jgi:UDP-glucose 4-epimerase
MNILVTGAAGYIGSIVAEELIRDGNSVIALDNLKQGHREAVAPEAIFVQLDLQDTEELAHLFERYEIQAVMHLAAESAVEYSMTDPRRYFQSNVIYGLQLLGTMVRHNVRKLVFSSTAAVYGQPEKMPIEESAPYVPVNAYGESKLIFEKALHWYGQAYGLKFISLRYFNAAGATERFGEDHRPETHLVPNVLKVALGQAKHVSIFGTDYPTTDGSCIRDYIHVSDIAKAHILALKQLERSEGDKAYNLGNGEGYSVIEVIEAARRVTGAEIPIVVSARRPGDPPALVSSSRLARSELGWQPDHPDLEAIIESAWRWQKGHPHGYKI